jgi:2-polyprenyl-3-methyl-5-hydroxy-6-metoxy-1,4-benzoquinol methylase
MKFFDYIYATKNYLHNIIFILYSIRNYFVSRPVWCYYTNNDLIYKSEQIIKLIELKKNPTILDLGCGNGIMLQPYLKLTKPENIIGVDNSYINIHQCSQNLKNVSKNNLIYENIETFIKDTNKTFDIILLHSVIGYFTYEKQNSILSGCINKLNKNGYIILSAVNYINDDYIFQTYPLKNITIIHNLCSINNLTYNVYNDSELELVLKYNAKTIIIKK